MSDCKNKVYRAELAVEWGEESRQAVQITAQPLLRSPRP